MGDVNFSQRCNVFQFLTIHRPGRQSQLAELEEQISSGCVAAVALLLANQVATALLDISNKFENVHIHIYVHIISCNH